MSESNPMPEPIPAQASVVVVGAGLSGLVAARDLMRAGHDDVVILEARDRVGGRLVAFERPGGGVLQQGGEFTGHIHVQLHALAAEFGIAVEPMPSFADVENMGLFVRVEDGKRYVEPFPHADDEAAHAAHAAAVEALEALARTIPADKPWNAPDAVDLDRKSCGQWLDDNVENAVAREMLGRELIAMGDPYEVSLLYLLWFAACSGGWEAMSSISASRFVGGSAQIPVRVADGLGDRVVLSAPVRRIEHGAEGVVVHTDRGSVSAGSVVIAMEPGQSGKIEYDPPLPGMRDRLQARWLANHGAKIFAVYERPFWRDENLAGLALSDGPFPVVMDVSPSDGSEGILCALYFADSKTVQAFPDALTDPERTRELTMETLELAYGPPAREATEFYAFSWDGDRWSDGCGSGLPLGVLSTVGRAWREPVGRIVWAGAETGTMDYMEGAVTSGQRAAREAAELVE